MRNGATTPAGRDYPTRYCEFCGTPIPKISKAGSHYWHSKYKRIKTCGQSPCIGLSQASTKPPEKIELPDDAFAKFLYGR